VGDCNRRHDYEQKSLKEHLLLSHGERPTLAKTILDLVDLLNSIRPPGAIHGGWNCLFCLRQALRGSR